MDDVKRSLSNSIDSAPPWKGLQAAIRDYLSVAHRDNHESGCPIAALGSELSRASPKVRQTASKGLTELVDLLAAQIGGTTTVSTRGQALVKLSTMIGAITLARLTNEPALSARILREAHNELLREKQTS